MRTVLILGITADIGHQLARRFAADQWKVAGTYRPGTSPGPGSAGWSLVSCDLASPASVDGAVQRLRELQIEWDLIVIAAGTEEPIGAFFEGESDAWERGFTVNALAPLRFLRGVHDFRKRDGQAAVVFFSGAGTNNAAPAYSAYCASKILLIKMCELLDAECPDTSFFILGPGIVRTKIHQQTLRAPAKSGANYRKVTDFLQSDNPGTSHEDIYQCVRWALLAGKAAVGGRNLSLVYDEWRDGGSSLAIALKANQDLYKLRRHGNHLKFSAPPA
jgi:NAD(P)-dependent dehydrogenase (short-subunit alcohol dehydrogenase family)